MTTSQPRYQDHSPELGCPENSSALPPPPPNRPPRCDQPPPLSLPPPFTGQPQLVPSPQFGRFSYSIRSAQTAEFRVRQADLKLHSGVATPVPRHIPPRPTGPLATFGPRAVSFLIDCLAPVIVLNLVLSIAAITGGAVWRLALAVVGAVVLLSFGIWNSGYLQGTTGRSLGRRVANTTLVGLKTGQPVGFARAVVRQVCHVLELGIGFLRPLWDDKRQTLADKIVGTVVIRTGGPFTDHAGT